MKKFGNYVIAISIGFSAAVFGASLLEKASSQTQISETSFAKVDVMGNISGD